MSCSDAMTTFSAIGAAGVVMDVHTGEVLAMTSLPEVNPNAAGRGARRTRGSTAPRRASTSSARPSSRSPSRWRWTAASSKASASNIIARNVLPAYGHLVHDTHPFGRICTVAEIMKESSNIGTAQIADQLGTRRQKVLARQDGLHRARSRSSSRSAAGR